MRKARKIVLAVVAILLVVVGAVAYWQKENLKAASDAMKYTQEELEDLMSQNQQALEEAVSAMPEITVRDLTEKEKEALRNGSITQEELIQHLTEKPAAPQEEMPADEKQIAFERDLSALIAKVYILRQQFLTRLEDMQKQAEKEYRGFSPSQRTKTNLIKWAKEYLKRASELELECDLEIDSIAVDMQKLIRDNHGDEGLIDTMINTYTKEKSLKKSWYMSQLKERGLVS